MTEFSTASSGAPASAMLLDASSRAPPLVPSLGSMLLYLTLQLRTGRVDLNGVIDSQSAVFESLQAF
jgi:hypothetical protein